MYFVFFKYTHTHTIHVLLAVVGDMKRTRQIRLKNSFHLENKQCATMLQSPTLLYSPGNTAYLELYWGTANVKENQVCWARVCCGTQKMSCYDSCSQKTSCMVLSAHQPAHSVKLLVPHAAGGERDQHGPKRKGKHVLPGAIPALM